ncbi:Ig-like domain-containing protein [Blastopirellula sediminis]|nr:Ig-like domain-containing protein [Blastopirellula sediminis]MCC9608302.1 Ig-like domain-containing protein [Blastopirellula sediminis]
MKFHWLSLLLCLLAIGCGQDGPDLAEVSGVITIDGKPLQGAVVSFSPAQPGGSPSYGQTDVEGKYLLFFSRDRTGAMPGTHNVTIETQKLGQEDQQALRDAGLPVPEYVAISSRYGQIGALTANVAPGENEVNLELTSDKK